MMLLYFTYYDMSTTRRSHQNRNLGVDITGTIVVEEKMSTKIIVPVG
jgi:hypothetical protein